jgi:hypothetical protein
MPKDPELIDRPGHTDITGPHSDLAGGAHTDTTIPHSDAPARHSDSKAHIDTRLHTDVVQTFP